MSDIKRYENKGGARVSTVSRRVINEGGNIYRDIDGTGKVSPVNDWHLSDEERAKAYAAVLTREEKIGLLFTSDWRMGPDHPSMRLMKSGHKPVPDESGLLDEAEVHMKNIFGEQHLPGTTDLLKNSFARHMILRENPKPSDMTKWLNRMQEVAEECAHFVPVEVMSNSRNENGEVIFGMNDAASPEFAMWPGTLGIAAAVRGTGDMGIIDRFADCIRREWSACGLRKGYMYMADCVTDPRWQRTYGTFGEDPELIAAIFDRLVPGIQGADKGVSKYGVAMTVKHFPGGGARENGFDPHYAAGQWNVYATEGSLAKYHMRTFLPAVKHGVSSIMPYYSKPSAEKSACQKDFAGEDIALEPYGFAYNKVFIDGILRKKMGFEGYINSDTGIIHNMSWGVEKLDIPERIGFAVTRGGVDLISGMFDTDAAKEAFARAENGYYDEHPVPEGFKREDIVLTDEALDRAAARTLREMFALGMMDDPYADPEEADRVCASETDREEAMRAQRASVVLLKDGGKCGKLVYARAFAKESREAERLTKELCAALKARGIALTDDPDEADTAVFNVVPSSGAYFSATKGYLELDICEDKQVCDVGDDGKPLDTTHSETTCAGIRELALIAEGIRARGGSVLGNINIRLAWQPGNLEPYCDRLTAGFETDINAVADALLGLYKPTGRLPLTLPRGDEALAVDNDGVCVSPNDVPGFEKDKYMPDALKDENGKAYAYRDANGNYYEYGFGLSTSC